MILDAREYVSKRTEELKEEVSAMDIKPTLAIIRVGDDKASEKYVNNKVKLCKEVGVESKLVLLKETSTQDFVEDVIKELNDDSKVTGILLQLPLPKHLDEAHLTSLISSKKDVDGFTSENIGNLVLGRAGTIACTPKGIINLLKYYNIPMEGKDVLIINRSNIVGKPLAHLFLRENATVTIAHSKTKYLKEKIWVSDIVVLGVGIPSFVGEPYFREGQTIVDVSINFDKDGKMCGDVLKEDYDKIIKKGCNITPVPNGVGRTTVLSLIEQTIKIHKKNNR